MGEQSILLSVDIGEGKTDDIIVTKKDDAYELAEAFCVKHNLSARAQQALKQYIVSEIMKIFTQDKSIQVPARVRPKTLRRPCVLRSSRKRDNKDPTDGECTFSPSINKTSRRLLTYAKSRTKQNPKMKTNPSHPYKLSKQMSNSCKMNDTIGQMPRDLSVSSLSKKPKRRQLQSMDNGRGTTALPENFELLLRRSTARLNNNGA